MQQQSSSSTNHHGMGLLWMGIGFILNIEVLLGCILTLQDLFMFAIQQCGHFSFSWTLMSGGLEAAARRKSCEMNNVTLWHSVLVDCWFLIYVLQFHLMIFDQLETSTSPRLFSYQPLDAAAKVEERKRSGFDKLCGDALAWINTLSWFVGASTETQKVLIDPQLSSLLLACLKLLLGPEAQPNSKASQQEGSSIHTESTCDCILTPFWRGSNNWGREFMCLPPTGDERSKIALFRVLEVPLLLQHLHCSVAPSSSTWNPFRLLRTNLFGPWLIEQQHIKVDRTDVLAVKKRKPSATISLIIYV